MSHSGQSTIPKRSIKTWRIWGKTPASKAHKREGACYLWLWLEGLPQGCTALYRRLKQRGVLIVPGRPCFFGLEEDWPHSDECIRVSYVQEESGVRRGVAIICDEVRRVYDEAG